MAEETKKTNAIILGPDDLLRFPEGKDSSEWAMLQPTIEKWAIWNGKRWRFLCRKPSFGTLLSIATRAKEFDKAGNVVGVDKVKYFMELMKAVFIETPFGQLTDVTIANLPPEAGQVLESILESMDLGGGSQPATVPNV